MSDQLLLPLFVAATVVSLATSWVLVSRLERVGARLGLSEALLGMLAALAADSPEITAAVTATLGHQERIGAGVVIGSNVFNLAALLGITALVSGGIALHRRVIVLEGAVAVWVASVGVATVAGVVSATVGLLLVVALLVPYVVALGVSRERLRPFGLPVRWARWLSGAIVEEELELGVAIHPRPGRARDAVVAGAAVLVVVLTSVAMERSGSTLGARHGISPIVLGALILAAVTSLPNAVAAVYLGRRGRGAATLSTAMNSNALNVAVGLLLPAAIVGLGAPSRVGSLIALWYLGMTLLALGCTYVASGVTRSCGLLIICAYLAFAVMIASGGNASPHELLLWHATLGAGGIVAIGAGWLRRKRSRSEPPPANAPSADVQQLIHEPSRHGDHAGPRARRRPKALVSDWTVSGVWWFALAITTIIALADAALGHHVILIGLLIIGPCCALLTGRWMRTASIGTWGIALAVMLGVPDGIWGTWPHAAFIAAVVIVAAATTAAALVLESRR
jgi:cation:H+ antiporter